MEHCSNFSTPIDPASKPPKEKSGVPKTSNLYQSMGFGSSFANRPRSALKDAIHHYRNQYVTSDGTPGKSLIDWKSPKTRQDLLQMTQRFIQEKGLRYWPSKGSLSPRSIPEYSQDADHITDRLVQLFWRQNKSQARKAREAKQSTKEAQVGESSKSNDNSLNIKLPPSTGHPRHSHPADPRPRRRDSRSPYRRVQLNSGLRAHGFTNASSLRADGRTARLTHSSQRVSTAHADGNRRPDPGAKIFDFAGSDTEVDQHIDHVEQNNSRATTVMQGHDDAGDNQNEISTSRSPADRQEHKASENGRSGIPTAESTANKQGHNNVEITRREIPKTQNVAPEAIMVAPSAVTSTLVKVQLARRTPPGKFASSSKPGGPTKRNTLSRSADPSISGPSRKSAPRTQLKARSKSEAPAESRGPKRKYPEDDDNAEWTPTKEIRIRPTLTASRSSRLGKQANPCNNDGPIEDANNREVPPILRPTVAEDGNSAPHPALKHELKPKIQICYSILTPGERLLKRHWPIKSLSGKSVQKLFEDVAKFTGTKTDIQRIEFRLFLAGADSEYTIQRGDAKTFQMMKEDFAEDIRSDWWHAGNTKFSIWLQPDPDEQGSLGQEADGGVEGQGRKELKVKI